MFIIFVPINYEQTVTEKHTGIQEKPKFTKFTYYGKVYLHI